MSDDPLFTAVACVNDDAVFERNLNSSMDILESRMALLTVEGVENVPEGLNDLSRRADTEYVVFTHQDVKFPPYWTRSVANQLERLTEHDPDWGYCGPAGAVWSGPSIKDGCRGWIRMNGEEWGEWFDEESPIRRVDTLDECCLIAKNEASAPFDITNPSRHLYAADACISTERRHWVIEAFLEHNPTHPSNELDAGFLLSAGWLWGKHYPLRNPVATTCCRIWNERNSMRLAI